MALASIVNETVRTHLKSFNMILVIIVVIHGFVNWIFLTLSLIASCDRCDA